MHQVRIFLPEDEFAALAGVLSNLNDQANTAAAKVGQLTPFRKALSSLQVARDSHYKRVTIRPNRRPPFLPNLPVSSLAPGCRE